VFGRFTLVISVKNVPALTYELVNIDEFCDAFKKSMNEKIKPVLEYGLKKYFEINPLAINTATLKAKQYLNIQN